MNAWQAIDDARAHQDGVAWVLTQIATFLAVWIHGLTRPQPAAIAEAGGLGRFLFQKALGAQVRAPETKSVSRESEKPMSVQDALAQIPASLQAITKGISVSALETMAAAAGKTIDEFAAPVLGALAMLFPADAHLLTLDNLRAVEAFVAKADQVLHADEDLVSQGVALARQLEAAAAPAA